MNGSTEDREDVIVFWDFETSPSLSSAAAISTYEMVTNIRSAVAPYGPLKSIRLYWDYGSHPFPSTTMRLRSEFSASGVNLIDCPAEGRRGAAIKKMLVDMIFHAWDSPVPSTFVVITGDRDVSYALAMLRMKSYRVVLISPAGSHPDLTSQASVRLDWSRTILDINGGSDEDGLFPKGSPDRMPSSTSAPARSSGSGSSKPGQDTLTFRSSATIRDSPAPAHRPPVFSSPYEHGLSLFGGHRFSSPKSSLGLGDGPLFPRPQSASQKSLRSRSGSLPELLRTGDKGKKKAPEEDVQVGFYPPPPPPPSQLRSSTSIFEPFDDDSDDDGLPIPRRSPAAPERETSNFSGPLQRQFSFEQINKPTEVDASEPVEQQPKQPSNGAPAQLSNGPRVVSTSSGVRKTETSTLPPPPLVVVPSTTSKAPKAATPKKVAPPPPRASGSSIPVVSSKSKSLPPGWVPLIETLRKHKGVLPRSAIALKILANYPNAFQKAGFRNIKRYLTAASGAGIVVMDLRANGNIEIRLTAPYFT